MVRMMNIESWTKSVAVLGMVVAAALPLRTAEAETAAGDVEFVIGDALPSEGGSWKPDTSPLRGPFGIDFDAEGRMYIVELTSGRLHRLNPDGEFQTISEEKEPGYAGDGGPLKHARFKGPHNAVVRRGNQLLVSDSWNHCVRQIDLPSMRIRTIVGNGQAGFSGDGGPATKASFDFVMCIELNEDQTVLHVTDLKNRRVRNVDLQTGIVTTVCGNGQQGVPADGSIATQSPLVDPRAAASDSDGNLYVLERGGHALRVVRPSGIIETIAGTGNKGFRDGAAGQAQFGAPKHLCCDPAGNVYIADDLNAAIRKYDPVANTVTTLLGRGFGDPRVTLSHPHGVRVRGDWLYVADTGQNRIFRLRLP